MVQVFRFPNECTAKLILIFLSDLVFVVSFLYHCSVLASKHNNTFLISIDGAVDNLFYFMGTFFLLGGGDEGNQIKLRKNWRSYNKKRI